MTSARYNAEAAWAAVSRTEAALAIESDPDRNAKLEQLLRVQRDDAERKDQAAAAAAAEGGAP